MGKLFDWRGSKKNRQAYLRWRFVGFACVQA